MGPWLAFFLGFIAGLLSVIVGLGIAFALFDAGVIQDSWTHK